MTRSGDTRGLNRRFRTVVLAAVATAAFGVFAGGAAAKVPTGPSGDGFYDATAKQLQGPHGKLIFARNASAATRISGATVKTVLYKSINAKNRGVEVSGLVAIPNKRAPRGGFPLITWAHGTTGLADKCAPSRFTEADITDGYIAYQNASIKSWIDKGFAVAMTDYQGLGTPGLHEYLIGLSEGRAVLDIVPAARKLFPSKISNRYAIAGHSQGGHAALWATGIARKWLPKSKLVGSAAFAPASNISWMAHSINNLNQPGGLSGLAVAIIKGAATQMPASSDITTKLNPRLLSSSDELALNGRSFWDAVDYECSGDLGAEAADPEGPPNNDGIAPSDLLQDYDISSGAVFSDPVVAALDAVFKANDPVFSNVSTPVWVPQGASDGTVFPYLTDDKAAGEKFIPADGLVWKLKRPSRKNKSVVYKEYAGLGHTEIVTDSAVQADFIAKLRAWF